MHIMHYTLKPNIVCQGKDSEILYDLDKKRALLSTRTIEGIDPPGKGIETTREDIPIPGGGLFDSVGLTSYGRKQNSRHLHVP